MTLTQHASATTVQTALQDAHARYKYSNPRSYEQYLKAAEVLPGGNTRTVLFTDPFPITLESAQGCYVTSLDGTTYVDFLGEYTAGLYGHSDPVLRRAVVDALDSGWVRGGHIRQEEMLARLICDRVPSIEQVRFTNSGTEANLYAISTTITVSGKSKVMVFEGGYHGGILIFGSTPNPLNAPFDFVQAPYNDWEGTMALLDAHRDDLACVILEPMQGSGGCIKAKPEFLRSLREWTAAHNTILIFDEVMTSRLSGGGLQEIHGIVPDMTTLGKYIGGGFSFGAFGGKVSLMEHYNPLHKNHFSHAGTFNNNVFTMSAGVAGLSQLLTPERATELSERGDKTRERLNTIAKKASFPMQFTGVGSMMNVHMCAGEINSIRDLTQSHADLRSLFYFDLLEQGIWAARRGMLNFSLPMGDEEASRLEHAVSHFVESRQGIVL